MSLPSAYLITAKNLEPLLNSLRNAKAPAKFTQRFLEELGFKSTNDRLFINVFKALGLISDDGTPTERYYEFLDQRVSARVLGQGIEEAYADLFRVRKDAHTLNRGELKGKIKTLTQGQYSDNVVDKMAMTFLELSRLASFGPDPSIGTHGGDAAEVKEDQAELEPDGQSRNAETRDETSDVAAGPGAGPVRLGGFVYNIELHLPETRDPAVYEALFKSLKAHLLS